MSRHKEPRRHQPDLDEIGINSFLIRNAKVQSLLKGEGVIVGNHFELLTWRREGLIARLRMRGFNVRTIEERIAALPALPEPAPLGEQRHRDLQHPKERYAHFDLIWLRWREVKPEPDTRKVSLRVGWVLRRKRGRGHADYYLATPEKTANIGLLPLDETKAVLMGYAQATEHGPRPIELRPLEGGYQLAQDLPLPPPHRQVLKIITSRSKNSSFIPSEGLDHIRQLFASLGLTIQSTQPS